MGKSVKAKAKANAKAKAKAKNRQLAEFVSNLKAALADRVDDVQVIKGHVNAEDAAVYCDLSESHKKAYVAHKSTKNSAMFEKATRGRSNPLLDEMDVVVMLGGCYCLLPLCLIKDGVEQVTSIIYLRNRFDARKCFICLEDYSIKIDYQSQSGANAGAVEGDGRRICGCPVCSCKICFKCICEMLYTAAANEDFAALKSLKCPQCKNTLMGLLSLLYKITDGEIRLRLFNQLVEFDVKSKVVVYSCILNLVDKLNEMGYFRDEDAIVLFEKIKDIIQNDGIKLYSYLNEYDYLGCDMAKYNAFMMKMIAVYG